MSFCLYGQGVRGVSLEQLQEEQIKDGMLLARVENSGCEGMYCEVAKWNEKTKRYERYAFEKFFGGEHPDHPDASESETAAIYAKQINCPGENCWDMADQGLIHSLPNYGEKPEPVRFPSQRVYVHPNEVKAPRAVYIRLPEELHYAAGMSGNCSCGKCDGTGLKDTLGIPLNGNQTWTVHWPDLEKTGVPMQDPYTLKTFESQGQKWKVST